MLCLLIASYTIFLLYVTSCMSYYLNEKSAISKQFHITGNLYSKQNLRFEQDNSNPKIVFDTPRSNDIHGISKLLVDCLDPDLSNGKYFGVFASILRSWKYLNNAILIAERLKRIMPYGVNLESTTNNWNYKSRRPHFMYVAKHESSIVGFVELGVSPMKNYDLRNTDSQEHMSLLAKQYNFDRPCMLCIGNLAVEKSFRRIGIASSLMSMALQSAESLHDEVYCEVEADNDMACDLYTNKFQFEVLGSSVSLNSNTKKTGRKLLIKRFESS